MISAIDRIRTGWKKARLERQLVRHSFPEFVSNSSIKQLGDQIPVFCFHAVGPEFLALLEHIERNGYQTLRADELLAALAGESSCEKPIVITFDDGWRSTWTLAYPWLKRFGFHAINFLVPTWMNDHEPSACLDLGSDLYAQLSDITALERAIPYLSWSEAKIMQDEGVFEFHSHSMTHDTVFTSGRIVDFVNPSFHRVPHKIPIVSGASLDPWQRSQSLGMPLYTVAPRFTGATGYLHNERRSEECMALVRESGGEKFFENTDWRQQLDAHASQYKAEGEYETDSVRDTKIRRELAESKQVIESKLGCSVNHFCFPFYAGSELASQISAELGYVANYWGWSPPTDQQAEQYGKEHLYSAIDETDYATGSLLGGRRSNRVGDNPFRIVRLPGDYIHCLPGEGRRSLLAMFIAKTIRNLRSK